MERRERGGDLFDIREGPPPSVRKWLREYGEYTFQSVIVCRKPIVSAINKAIDLISTARGVKPPYDKLYHLFMVATLRSKGGNPSVWRIEKNAVVTVTPNGSTGGVCKTAHMSGTVAGVFARAGATEGRAMWVYDAIRANCQRFIAALLKAGGGLTPELDAFVSQDVSKLLPSYAERFARGATNIASWVDKVIYGKGFRGARVQSVAFNRRAGWGVPRARHWLEVHHYRAIKEPDERQAGWIRIRIEDPQKFKRFTTVKHDSGVNLTLGWEG